MGVTQREYPRSNRFEIRTTAPVRAQIKAVAVQTRRTVTSLLDEAIEDLVKKYTEQK